MDEIERRALRALALGAFLTAGLAQAQDAARINGRVLSKNTGATIAGALVEFAPGARRMVSDDSGRFSINDIVPGNVTLLVRHLGFLPESLYITLGTREDLDVRIELRPAVLLDTVAVRVDSAPRPYGRLSGFYERRKTGIGRFMDASDIERLPNRHLADVITARLPGTKVVRSSTGSAAYIATSRTARRVRRGTIPPACYAAVYLDGIHVNSRQLFDVNLIDPGHVAAIEFFVGGQIPAEYNRIGAGCGVLLLWTK